MAKRKTSYICQQCGYISPAFLGRCPECGEWNTMVETIEETGPRSTGARKPIGAVRAASLASVGVGGFIDRIPVPIEEMNRVLGGGLVRGSLVLLGGDAAWEIDAGAAIAGALATGTPQRALYLGRGNG